MTVQERDLGGRLAEWAAQDTAENPEDLVGQVLKKEGAWLRTQAALVQSGQVIVELGSYTGKSTACLAVGSGEGERAPVYAVDLWDHGTSVKGHSFEKYDPNRHAGQSQSKFHHPLVLAKFHRRMHQYDKAGLVSWIQGDTKEIGAGWDGKRIGLLFIDAEHTEEAVRRDFEVWSPHVEYDGLVVFHDYKGGREANGVRRVVDALESWEIVATCGSIVAVRRHG